MVKQLILLLLSILHSFNCAEFSKFGFQKVSKPLCQPFEACAINHYGVNSICQCPEMQQCKTIPAYNDNLNLRKFQFCEPLQLSKCKRGQLMLEVENYHHLFHCICPDHLESVSISWSPELDKSRYVCSKHRTCDDEEICRRTITYSQPRHLTKLRKLCECKEEQICGDPIVQIISNAKVEEYKCITPPPPEEFQLE